MPKPKDISRSFMEAIAEGASVQVHLRLYVAGNTRHSIEAIRSLKEICELRLHGRYRLEVIDIYQRPELAKDDQIIAVPTLLRMQPLPMRRLIGNLTDQARVLAGLDLQAHPPATPDAHGNEGAPAPSGTPGKAGAPGAPRKTHKKER